MCCSRPAVGEAQTVPSNFQLIEALQEAQISLIESQQTVVSKYGEKRSLYTIPNSSPDPKQLNHPYYWAPFIPGSIHLER